MWLSSLTPQAIQEAFASLKPLAAFDNLYASARCRSEADWIVGINGTRYFTVRNRNTGTLWSVGRVQTPVLAMIARRDNEIKNFQPKPFWELLTKYRDTVFRYVDGRFDEEAAARTYLQRVTAQPLVIQCVENQPQTSLPPQLYDLTELQRDMNRRFRQLLYYYIISARLPSPRLPGPRPFGTNGLGAAAPPGISHLTHHLGGIVYNSVNIFARLSS